MDKAKGLHTYKPYYYNRELSWLKFNERVLDEAIDKEVPLCERLSFVSIFQSNLDEFFMVRVGTLTDQMIFSADARDNKTQMTAKEQLSEIFTSVGELLRKKDRAYLNLMSEIGEYGIELISFNDIEFADAVYLENYFKHSIMPLLSPQIVGKKQPFPFLRNKEIYAVALLKSKNNEKLGIVPCSSEVFKRLIPIPSDKNKYMLVEELILHFMPQIFSKYTIKSKSLIRIIRNADIDVDDAFYDEDLDYRNTMEKMIREWVTNGGVVLHGPDCGLSKNCFGIQGIPCEKTPYIYQKPVIPQGCEFQRYETGRCISAYADDAGKCIVMQEIEKGKVISCGVQLGASYVAKNIPHVPYEQRNKEMYPIIQARSTLLEDLLGVCGKPVSGICERGIEAGVFETGMVLVNHRSTPYEIGNLKGNRKFTNPVNDTVLLPHSAVWIERE